MPFYLKLFIKMCYKFYYIVIPIIKLMIFGIYIPWLNLSFGLISFYFYTYLKKVILTLVIIYLMKTEIK